MMRTVLVGCIVKTAKLGDFINYNLPKRFAHCCSKKSIEDFGRFAFPVLLNGGFQFLVIQPCGGFV